MAAAKQYEVVRAFRRTDPKTYEDTDYNVGDTYSGQVEDSYLDPDGPDGRGPLLAEKKSTVSSSDTGNKEK